MGYRKVKIIEKDNPGQTNQNTVKLVIWISDKYKSNLKQNPKQNDIIKDKKKWTKKWTTEQNMQLLKCV